MDLRGVRGRSAALAAIAFAAVVALPAAGGVAPGGGRIAFSYVAYDGGVTDSAIYVVDADGGDLRRVLRRRGVDLVAPFWSADGRRLTFGEGANLNDNASIWTVNPDGTGRRRLTPRALGRSRLAWSPDGGRLLFGRERLADGEHEVWVTTAAGTRTRRLSRPSVHDVDAEWSPTGRHIAFLRSAAAVAPAAAWVMDGDGTNQRQVSPADVDVTDLSWSADGTVLAFAADPATRGQSGRLFVVKNDGTESKELSGSWVGFRSLDWAPRGHRLLVGTRGHVDGVLRADLYVADVTRASIRRITAAVEGEFPEWSPDGRTIVFMSLTGTYRIYTIGADGTSLRRLTRGTWDYFPTWSPDGRKLLFSRAIEAGAPGGHLWVMNADGSRARNLTRSFESSTYLSWGRWQPQPRGR